QGERQLDAEANTAPRLAVYPDCPVQALDAPLHYVHADTAPGDIGHRLGCGEARFEDQAVDATVAQILLCSDDSTLHAFGAKPFTVEPTASVGDVEHYVAALMVGMDPDLAARRFARRGALRRRLDAVIHGVAHQVHQRIAKPFHNAFVEFGFLSLNFQGRL